MKTEFDYGYEYAADNGGEYGPVDIDEMVNSTQSIPDGDYTMMKKNGIEYPDTRKYWKGYNSFFD
jgi:hypothetical protein